ncbi:hypothetical protein [Pacificoceanicola onchidii]|uniref:hypothetical protein n=1 Tax=Pacificoceanicola onchidii TaxID=2562685 RepID=UPI0010A6B3EC|nr:hypothetical protein [Pacificoceanicola onchidii]
MVSVILRLLSLYLPVLFPSWRFFKTVGPSPRVEYRINDSDWIECRHRPHHVGVGRMLRRMLWNPRWNEQLFLVSLSERLASDPDQAGHARQELEDRLIRLSEAPPGSIFAFRLIFLTREEHRIGMFIEYESPTITVPDNAL